MAWHAIFLFLKSMESLEDFRKNSHVQIPSKSPCTKFQSLTNSKNQFKIRKEILPLFQPEQPNWPDPPFWPSPPGRPSHLHSSWAIPMHPYTPFSYPKQAAAAISRLSASTSPCLAASPSVPSPPRRGRRPHRFPCPLHIIAPRLYGKNGCHQWCPSKHTTGRRHPASPSPPRTYKRVT
jgi:hypothetical protein